MGSKSFELTLITANGRIARTEWTKPNSSTEVSQRIVFDYDDAGRLVRRTTQKLQSNGDWSALSMVEIEHTDAGSSYHWEMRADPYDGWMMDLYGVPPRLDKYQ